MLTACSDLIMSVVTASAEQAVMINCMMGVSRSTSIIIAYLIMRRGMSFDEALALVKSKRSQCQPNANFARQLKLLKSGE